MGKWVRVQTCKTVTTCRTVLQLWAIIFPSWVQLPVLIRNLQLVPVRSFYLGVSLAHLPPHWAGLYLVQNVLCDLSQAVNYLKNKGVYVKKYSSSGGVLQRTLNWICTQQAFFSQCKLWSYVQTQSSSPQGHFWVKAKKYPCIQLMLFWVFWSS